MAGIRLWQVAGLALPTLILVHLVVAPYTKVEESFNIQAVHDVLTYGLPTEDVYATLKTHFDHMTFSGAVPRTFIGAIVLGVLAKPLALHGHLSGEDQQMLVRALLGLFNAAALISYLWAARRAFGVDAAAWYCLIQASQFHIFYYASRTLPNMFAFGITTFALAALLPNPTASMTQAKRTRLGLYLLTLATVIFRSELALLLGSHCLHLLLRSPTITTRIILLRNVLIPAVVVAAIAGLILTVGIDTYMWQSENPLWPELAAFLSNVFPSKDDLGASAWGTSPFHWYFTSAMPRLLCNPILLVLIPYGFTTSLASSLFDLLFPSITYTALYSVLPHKETRFLFPIVPPLTLSVALVASYISTRHRTVITNLTTLIIIITTLATTIISHGILLPLSAQNYPGALALQSVHNFHANHHETSHPHPHVSVHLTNLALQTGVTLFLQNPSSPSSSSSRNLFLPGSPDGKIPSLKSSTSTAWIYDKSDNATLLLTPSFWSEFDYAVVEDPARAIGGWDVVDRIPALSASSPRILAPDVGRGTLVIGPEETRREDDALARLVESMYGRYAKWAYGVVHDVLREGVGLGGLSLTKGYWVHWGLETRLYVLRRAEYWEPGVSS